MQVERTEQIVEIQAGQVWGHRLHPAWCQVRITRPGHFEYLRSLGGPLHTEKQLANEQVLRDNFRLAEAI
jgi:hypothetical protein